MLVHNFYQYIVVISIYLNVSIKFIRDRDSDDLLLSGHGSSKTTELYTHASKKRQC
jgi:hypothetical protein